MTSRNTKRKDRAHLAKELKVSSLLDDTNDEILNGCFNQVADIFGGTNSFWHFVSHNANEDQLESINNIIIAKKEEHQNENIMIFDELQSTEMKDEYTQLFLSTKYFVDLSTDQLTHICGYLDKRSIKQFKLSSKYIATICLQEMSKISVGICNANSLLINNIPKTNLHRFKFYDFTKFTRYNPKKKYSSLFDEWERNYNISQQHQLLTHDRIPISNLNQLRNTTVLSKKVKENRLVSYVLFDKRKIIFLDKNTQKKSEPANINLDNYKISILEYFDIFNQEMKVIQFLCCNKQHITLNRILRYIEHHFIPTDDDNSWYEELKSVLSLMPFEQNKKLMIHSHQIKIATRNYSSSYRPGFKEQLIFELNSDHKFFRNNDRLNETKKK
eukprot:427571_1